MKHMRHSSRSTQRGVVLVTSLLLLLVVTVMALSMFRSFGMQERIAGNVREKQRALQVANSTQEYAEWWLANQSGAIYAVSQGSAAAADVTCGNTVVDANAPVGAGQICIDTLRIRGISAATWPSSIPSAGPTMGVLYTPPGMSAVNYAVRPGFYIADAGALATARGEVYQVDAYGFGLTSNAISVVESTVAVTCIVCNVGGL